MSKKELSYSDAIKEIEEILQSLEDDEVDVDNVAKQLKRAVLLLEVCRKKLDKAETEVCNISDIFEKDK